MKTIKNNVINETIINKSKFICLLVKVDNINEINKHINKIKNEYKDATHCCYAYILDNVKRFSDDGEPGGTAGMPILNVLEKNKLNHILAVVVRYFGGIKLGTGGLVRAYTNSVANNLNNTNIIELKKGYIIKLEFNYENNKLIDNYLKNVNITDKSFNETIVYNIKITDDEFNKIKDLLKNIADINIKKEILI